MLVNFRVKNFMSIEESILLDLRASSQEKQAHAFNSGISGTHLLNTTAIYGANASGKTTIVLALKVMQEIVREGFITRGIKLRVEPFLLDKKTKDKPSEFEVNLIIKGTHYRYGFSATREKITKEWLYAYPNGEEKECFTRPFGFNSESDQKQERWQEIKEMAGDNVLWLSLGAVLKASYLEPSVRFIFDWFDKNLKIIVDESRLEHLGLSFSRFGRFSNDISNNNAAEMCKDEKTKTLILKYLESVDFSIKKIEVIPKTEVIPEERRLIRSRTTISFRPRDKLKLFHSNEHQEGFDLQQESAGTQRFLELLTPWITALRKGHTLVVDELNEKLHSRLIRFLWEMFQNKDLNKKHAQLVVTTHDTSLLSLVNDLEPFKDCIWFCAKKDNGATLLFPLSTYETDSIKDIEEAYRTGRFGGVPFVGDIDFIIDALLEK
ncbi:AAA family ATPase [Helicobacter pylori]|uniref:AAA family ATPase n=1 Tax=Helicobacter pylori TaxID=210 RepID=UPI001920480F|nr:ATP-binding protein [Helicobacter pylori]QQW82445.1 ATP-binding protein [Helicobacter pylori]